jgi:hypothetical protein
MDAQDLGGLPVAQDGVALQIGDPGAPSHGVTRVAIEGLDPFEDRHLSLGPAPCQASVLRLVKSVQSMLVLIICVGVDIHIPHSTSGQPDPSRPPRARAHVESIAHLGGALT